MPTKEQRQAEAKKHLGLMKAVFAKETAASAEAATIYEDGEGRELDTPEARFDATATPVSTDFSVTALFKCEGKAAAVDPAAFSKPGGNYEAGAFGPEQALCAESNLYPILQKLKGSYYDPNRDYWCGQLFTDRAVFVPDVAFMRDGAIRKAGVVVVAAPHRTHALENHRSEAECDLTLASRIETLLRIAATNEVDELVVNAFGCGVLGNDAAQVAGLFKAWIDAHPGVFRVVAFAVPRAQLDAFTQVFGAPEKEEAAPAPTPASDEDDEGFSIDDLPEGVTFRS